MASRSRQHVPFPGEVSRIEIPNLRNVYLRPARFVKWLVFPAIAGNLVRGCHRRSARNDRCVTNAGDLTVVPNPKASPSQPCAAKPSIRYNC